MCEVCGGVVCWYCRVVEFDVGEGGCFECGDVVDICVDGEVVLSLI